MNANAADISDRQVPMIVMIPEEPGGVSVSVAGEASLRIMRPARAVTWIKKKSDELLLLIEEARCRVNQIEELLASE